MKLFYGWVIVAITALVSIVSFGTRFSFGIFLKPIAQELTGSYAVASLVLSTFVFTSGAMQPVLGALVDRFGGRRVIAAGVLVFAAGLIAATFAPNAWGLVALLGVIGATGFSGTSLVITGAVVARWFRRNAGTALGINSAGINFGQAAFVPVAAWAVLQFGWRPAMLGFGAVLLLLLPVIWRWLRSDPAEMGLAPEGESPAGATPVGAVPAASAGRARFDRPVPLPLVEVARTRPFWLMTFSLIGCGFLMNVIFIHFPTYAHDHSNSTVVAASAMSLMGAMGSLGGLASGWLSDRIGKQRVLAGIYLLRTVITLAVAFWPSVPMLFGFAVGFGLFGFGTVALTSGLSGDVFGHYTVGRIFGWIYVLHQVAGALGTYLGGLSVDRFGTVAPVLMLGALISVGSAATILGVSGEPLQQPTGGSTFAPSATGN